MSITYTPTTNFGAKDSLPANDPAKVIKGTEFTTEFTAIQSAFATAAPAASPTFTGTATFDDVSITNGLTVDGTTLVVDDTNNRVGIGTASPAAALDLFEGADERLKFTTVGSNAGIISTNAADSAYQPLEIQASTLSLTQGRVGIGTTSPGQLLDISSASNTVLRLSNAGTNTWDIENDSNLKFSRGTSEYMRIDSSGNVGIGTNAPAVNLEIKDSLPTLRLQSSANAGYGNIAASSGSIYISADSGNTEPSSGIIFNVDGTQRAIINSSGNVGIGDNSPAYKTTVVGTTSLAVDTEGLLSDATTTTVGCTAGGQSLNLRGASSGNIKFSIGSTEHMRIDSSGNLLVGGTSALRTSDMAFIRPGLSSGFCLAGGPALEVSRNGSYGTVVQFYKDGTTEGGININSGAAPSFSGTSDIRLKENITDHESELANVMALRPVRWDWKDNDNSGEGFIAQELQETAWADLVSEGDDGMLQVSGLGAVETRLIKALQEAVTRIESLEAEVEALKNA